MVEIRIERDSASRIEAYSAKGHAESGPVGQDIVCAAISVLTDTAFLGLSRHLGRKLSFKAKDGMLNVRLQTVADDLTEAILGTMLLGLQEIKKMEPDRIRIIDNRR
jgi:uncharacterized protein YsxB (DUF464 family)